MTSGVGAFNKAASSLYSELPLEEKQRLKKLADEKQDSVEMTEREIVKAGAKFFKKIHHQVR